MMVEIEVFNQNNVFNPSKCTEVKQSINSNIRGIEIKPTGIERFENGRT